MNDTPKTDAFFFKRGSWSDDILAFCRRMERERNQARDQVEELTAVIKGLRAIMRQDASK
jgi:hypothetical protein